jgi:hypothetical protein
MTEADQAYADDRGRLSLRGNIHSERPSFKLICLPSTVFNIDSMSTAALELPQYVL